MSLDVQRPTRSKRPLVIGMGVVGVFVLGVAVGVVVDGSRDGEWLEGSGHVGAQQVTVETDDWTFGAEGAVPSWIDTHGSFHDGGWPDCLKQVGSTRTVRFVAADVEVEGVGFRPIVAVDCRG